MNYPRIDDRIEAARSRKESLDTRCRLYHEASCIEEYRVNRTLYGLDLPWFRDECMVYYYMNNFGWFSFLVSGIAAFVAAALANLLWHSTIGNSYVMCIIGKNAGMSELTWIKSIFSFLISSVVFGCIYSFTGTYLRNLTQPVRDYRPKSDDENFVYDQAEKMIDDLLNDLNTIHKTVVKRNRR